MVDQLLVVFIGFWQFAMLFFNTLKNVLIFTIIVSG